MSKVLVVDDVGDARELARIILEQAGHEVVQAASGEDALDVLDLTDVDVVLLDLRLPGMDGWDVLDALRERNAIDDVAVVLFSAHSDPEFEARALAGGARGYLEKPYKMHELVEAVERHTAGP